MSTQDLRNRRRPAEEPGQEPQPLPTPSTKKTGPRVFTRVLHLVLGVAAVSLSVAFVVDHPVWSQVTCNVGLGEEDFTPEEVRFPFDIEKLSKSFGHGPQARLQHGLFAAENLGKEFDAFVRTSGDPPENKDNSPEARGLAIKVLNVAGEQLEWDNSCPHSVQDFVLLSSDFFFTKNVEYYASLLKAFTAGGVAGVVPWAFGFYNMGDEPAPVLWDPRTWQPYTLVYSMMIGFAPRSMTMPLDWKYSSATPYANGPAPNPAVKFHVEPCDDTFSQEERNEYKSMKASDPQHFMANALTKRLGRKPVCLSFFIQSQEKPCKELVGDPRLSWSTPKVKVAEIHVPQQDFLVPSQAQRCVGASFNPWNGLKDHRPLGTVNYARKIAYGAGAQYRNGGGCPAQMTPYQEKSKPSK